MVSCVCTLQTRKGSSPASNLKPTPIFHYCFSSFLCLHLYPRFHHCQHPYPPSFVLILCLLHRPCLHTERKFARNLPVSALVAHLPSDCRLPLTSPDHCIILPSLLIQALFVLAVLFEDTLDFLFTVSPCRTILPLGMTMGIR